MFPSEVPFLKHVYNLQGECRRCMLRYMILFWQTNRYGVKENKCGFITTTCFVKALLHFRNTLLQHVCLLS